MAVNGHRDLLAARRALLVQRAAAQRQQLAQAVAPLAQSWRWFERGLGLWREVQRRPWLVAVPAGALLFWRRRAVLGTVAALPVLPVLWRLARAALKAQRQGLR